MGLTRWDPAHELQALRHQMNRLLDETMRGRRFGWWRRPVLPEAGPRLDVYQTDTEVVVTAELPGIESKEDVEVTATEDSLSLKGEIKRGQDIRDEHYYHSERYYGAFHRTLPLPVKVKPAEARATYRNGVLEVRLPKAEPGRDRTVRIDVH